MARQIQTFTISVQNVIPELAQTPLNNNVMIIAAGAPAIPTVEYTVSGTTVIWDEVTAGYNLEIGDTVVADYDDDTGEGGGTYNPADPEQNPVLVDYDKTVTQLNTAPKLIHTPVASTFIMKVNDVRVYENTDWTRNGRNINWVSATDLIVGDIVNYSYRRAS